MSASLGVNLGFASKRWSEPEAWTALVSDELGITDVQFTYDLLDPWWPDAIRTPEAARVRAAAERAGVRIHSAQVGLAWYTFSGLLSPDPSMRANARAWWERAIEVAAAIGARAAGGPLGALTVTSSMDPGERERRFEELVEVLARLQALAARAGLEALLVEPTPLGREIPSSLEEAKRLSAALAQGPVPIKYVLDNGHAMLEPFYGPQASMRPWLAGLGDTIGVLHLQNTDRQSDSHWGWPDARADLSLASWAEEVRRAGLADVPVFIEVMYPFELDDHEVLASLRSTVAHCREALSCC
jgi:D-erythrulose 1-phosphate 3-epimerase